MALRERCPGAAAKGAIEMTEHRSRKTLVRARMARTGESYTTAHRHVVGTPAATGIAGLVPGYPAFGAHDHRVSSLTRHVLGQAGVPVSEPTACGLGGGIGFCYAVFDYKSVPHPLVTIVAQHHPRPWLEATVDHLGLTATTVTSSAPARAMAKLDATLDGGRPAWIVVGRSLLPWHDEAPGMEGADPFPVVVAGRAGGEYLIDDGAAEPRRIDADALVPAWSAYRKGRLGITTIDRPMPEVDLAAGVIAALATTVDDLRGPVLHNYFDANMGLSGIARWASELRDQTKHGWPRRFSDPAAFRIAMGRVAECLTWQYTAPGGTRPTYAAFLAEAAGIAGLELGEAAALARRAGETWTAVADVAGAAAHGAAGGADRAAVLGGLAELVESAHDTETAMAASIDAAIGPPARQTPTGSSARASASSSSS